MHPYLDDSPLQLTEGERKAALATLNGDIYMSSLAPSMYLYGLTYFIRIIYNNNLNNVSADHVLPQHPDTESEWYKLLPDAAEREGFVHRLGNLVSLSHRKTSAASRFDFATKEAEELDTTDEFTM